MGTSSNAGRANRTLISVEGWVLVGDRFGSDRAVIGNDGRPRAGAGHDGFAAGVGQRRHRISTYRYTVENAEPDRAFDDGKHLSIVAVGEVWAPAWLDVPDGLLSANSGSSNFLLVAAVVIGLRWFLWRVFFNDHDKRWRLLVHRTSRRRRKWRVVKIEFFDTANDARARQAEILQNWGQCVRQNGWDDAPGITASERRALRRGSRAGQKRRSIGFLVLRSVVMLIAACVALVVLLVIIGSILSLTGN